MGGAGAPRRENTRSEFDVAVGGDTLAETERVRYARQMKDSIEWTRVGKFISTHFQFFTLIRGIRRIARPARCTSIEHSRDTTDVSYPYPHMAARAHTVFLTRFHPRLLLDGRPAALVGPPPLNRVGPLPSLSSLTRKASHCGCT